MNRCGNNENVPSSFTLLNTSSLLIPSTHLILCVLLHLHFGNFKFVLSVFSKFHIVVHYISNSVLTAKNEALLLIKEALLTTDILVLIRLSFVNMLRKFCTYQRNMIASEITLLGVNTVPLVSTIKECRPGD